MCCVQNGIQTTTAIAADRNSSPKQSSDEGRESKPGEKRSCTEAITPSGANSTITTNSAIAASTNQPPPPKRAWRDQPHVGKYKLIRTLGSGNFAKVKLAQHITTKKEVGSTIL